MPIGDADERQPCGESRAAKTVDASLRTVQFVAYTDSHDVAGAEFALGNLLGALHDRYQVTVVGEKTKTVNAIAAFRPGAETMVLPPVRNKFQIGPILAQVRAIRSLQPEIFHASLRHPWSCQYGLFAALTLRATHTIAVEHLPLPSNNWLQRWFMRRVFLRLDAHVVAGGERSARLVEVLAGLRVGSVVGIPNGVDDVGLEPLARVSKGPVIGALGRLHEQKAFDVLVRALPMLPGVTAVLVGDGPERASLEQRAADLGVTDRLVITGWREDARRYLAGFDAYVLPSRYESFPLSILEAMLQCLPVVATDVGSVADAVRHGKTGLIIPQEDPEALAEAVTALLDDASLREKMGKAGRSLALERFSIDAMSRSFESIYGALLVRS